MNFLQKFFREVPSEHLYAMTVKTFVRLVVVSLSAGVITWLLALAIDRLLLGAVFCGGDAATNSICMNSVSFSSYIATVLTAIMLVPIVAVLRIKRPLLVVAAATIVLWGASIWTNGSWPISLLLNAVIFVLVYVAVSWINRLRHNVAAIIALAMFTVIARLILLA